jgi:hypothetical protein
LKNNRSDAGRTKIILSEARRYAKYRPLEHSLALYSVQLRRYERFSLHHNYNKNEARE